MTRAVLRRLSLFGILAAGCQMGTANVALQETNDAVSRLAPAVSADDLQTDVAFLASDECGGRLTGTPGAARAGAYVAAAMKQAGLQPAFTDGYFQPFEFTAGVRMLDDQTRLEVIDASGATQPAGLNVDFSPRTFSANGSVEGEVVFAGFGLVEPASAGQGYDSYASLDVKGKVVLALADLPENVTPERRQELALYSGDRYKAKLAADRGAVGFLLVTGPNSPNPGKLVAFRTEDRTSAAPIVAASITGDLADRLLAGAGADLKKLQDMLDGGQLNPHAMISPGSRVRLSVQLGRVRKTCRNVVGLLPPTGECDQYVMVGAHYDHIGTGEGLGSLAKAGEENQIHNGADDNASGTSVVLEIAAAVAEARGMVTNSEGGMGPQSGPVKASSSDASDTRPQRGVIFALWSGEELGLVGSTHYAEHPVVPLDNVVAYFNFDMVGRLRDNKLILQSVGSSPAWRGLVERRNVPAGFSLALQDDPYLPTDATAFYSKGIPALAFFTDLHEDYNRPTDDADTLNYVGMERVAMFARRLIEDVSKPDFEVAYARVEQSAPRPERGGRRAYTGTVPDFAASDKTGVRLSDVRPGGPADQAGIKAGDIIVEFAGQPINNLQDYSDVLMGVKIGQPVNLTVERDGQRITLTITPTARP